MCFWWASEQDVRVSRGRFRDLILRLWSMFAHRCIAVCSIVGCCTWYAGMWVSYLQGGILRAISPAGRRVFGRISCKITMFMHTCAPFPRFPQKRLIAFFNAFIVYEFSPANPRTLCYSLTFFFLCVFDAWALLLSLYGRYFYIVNSLQVVACCTCIYVHRRVMRIIHVCTCSFCQSTEREGHVGRETCCTKTSGTYPTTCERTT